MPYPSTGPNPSQVQFHKLVLSNMWTAFFGGVRCGKSRAALEQIFEFANRYPGIKIGIFRKYEEDLNDTCLADFDEHVPKHWIVHQKNKGKTKTLRNGSKIVFKGMYSRNSGRLQKIGSLTFGAIWVEEADDLDERDFLLLKARLSQPEIPANERRGWIVANPPTVAHWLYRLFGPTRQPGHAALHGKTSDNVAHLGEEYLEDLRRTYSGPWAKRLLDGEFGVSLKGTPVIEGFDPMRHVEARPVDKTLSILRSWDFGFHRPCVTFWQFNGHHWHWFHTLLGRGIHLREYIPQVQMATDQLMMNANVWDACDIAGHQQRDNADKTSIEILGEYGIYPMSRKTPSTYDGVDYVQRLVTEGRLSVSPSNNLAIEALAGGWQVESDGEGKDRDRFRILKDGIYDHVGDTVRYLMVNWFTFKPDSVIPTKVPGTWGWYEEKSLEAEKMAEQIGNEGFTAAQCMAALGTSWEVKA